MPRILDSYMLTHIHEPVMEAGRFSHLSLSSALTEANQTGRESKIMSGARMTLQSINQAEIQDLQPPLGYTICHAIKQKLPTASRK